MANSPSIAENSSLPEPADRFLDAIADRIARGETHSSIAASMYPHDARKRKQLRQRIKHLAQTEPRLAAKVAGHGQMVLMYSLVPALEGLARRAKRGDVQAVKLLTEASGFHNPRVKHDHSGSIEVKLTMPRPERPEPVDAEVVEDSS